MLYKAKHEKAKYNGPMDKVLIDAFSGASTMAQDSEAEKEIADEKSIMDE